MLKLQQDARRARAPGEAEKRMRPSEPEVTCTALPVVPAADVNPLETEVMDPISFAGWSVVPTQSSRVPHQTWTSEAAAPDDETCR